jgi:UDP-N-acetylglucosamine 2-epimerase
VFYSIFNDQQKYHNMANKENPYGDGKATERIAEYFLNQDV